MSRITVSIYKAMYVRLFNQVTEAIEEIQRGNAVEAAQLLIAAQQEAEETYISGTGEE